MSDSPLLRLVVARHGNTFASDVLPTRVGARTDLPLTDAGLEQGRRLGRHWLALGWTPSAAWCGTLRRTRQTAVAALSELAVDMTPVPDPRFTEIDYGPDENQPEYLVHLRLGRQALGRGATDAEASAAGERIVADWDARGAVPDGWRVDPAALAAMWTAFADECARAASVRGATVIVVTSNGTARFAPALAAGGLEAFLRDHPRGAKLSTGAYGVFELGDDNAWRCAGWNLRPE